MTKRAFALDEDIEPEAAGHDAPEPDLGLTHASVQWQHITTASASIGPTNPTVYITPGPTNPNVYTTAGAPVQFLSSTSIHTTPYEIPVVYNPSVQVNLDSLLGNTVTFSGTVADAVD